MASYADAASPPRFAPESNATAAVEGRAAVMADFEVTLFPCEGSSRQSWAFNGAGELQLRAMGDGQLCVGRRADPKTGVLTMTPCGGGDTGEWAYDAAGAVVDALTGRCLVDAADAAGAAVDAPCWAPDAYDWTHRGATGELALRKSGGAEMCLTAGWPFLQWGAFQTPDDDVVVVALNEAPRPAKFDIDLGDGTVVGADMPARSMQTYVFEGAAVEGK